MRSVSVVLLALCAHSLDAYKILVYNSKYAHSHSNYLGQIADTLVDAGHNVTSLIPIADPATRDGTERSHKIYVQPDPVIAAMYADTKMSTQANFFEMNQANPIIAFFIGPMFADIFYRTCKRVMDEPGLLDRLRAEKYDVMIAENFDMCGIGLSKIIAPKSMIGVSSGALFSWHFSEFGVPDAVSYRPTSLSTTFDVHSFRSRLFNLYGDAIGRLTFWFSRRSVNRALREQYGPEYPTVAELSSNVAYVFTNSEPLIESAAPTMARVIDIGGIGAKTAKKLDEYWEGILTRRPKTVLLSFGSIAKSILIPPAMKAGILKAIASIPDVTFIWKYEEPEDEFCTEHASKVKNLVLTKWMPQVDILAHPNLAVFITHGGMGSTQETALRGVPGIFIPLFADQPRNAGMMEFNGFGKVFDKRELVDGEKLAATIREVLGNENYRKNAKRVSAMLAKKPISSRDLLIKHVEFGVRYRDNARRISAMIAKKPFSSREQLIRTVEFAAEFGPSAVLRPQSHDMSYVEYHNLDIVVGARAVLALLASFMHKLVAVIIRKCTLTKQKND